MSIVLTLLQHLEGLTNKPLPEFTCPLIDKVVHITHCARRETWDLDKKTPYELKRSLREVQKHLEAIPGIMECIRFSNSELRDIAAPASEIALAAKLMLNRFRRNLMQCEQLTVEQIDAILDTRTDSDEIGDEDDEPPGAVRITYVSAKEADRP